MRSEQEAWNEDVAQRKDAGGTGNRIFGVSSQRSLGYSPSVESDDGETVQGQISEFHLRKAIEKGARISRVIVAALSSTGDYVPWVRLSDQAGYSRLSTRKYEGPKTFRDFRIMQRTLTEFGFSGPVHVYPEGHPFLLRLTG
jgi:hypothetical protein